MSGKGGRSYADMARRVMGAEQPDSSGGFSVRGLLESLSSPAQQQTLLGYDPSQEAANNTTRSLLGAYNAVKTQPAPYDPQEFWRRASAGVKQDPRAWDNSLAIAGMVAPVGKNPLLGEVAPANRSPLGLPEGVPSGAVSPGYSQARGGNINMPKIPSSVYSEAVDAYNKAKWLDGTRPETIQDLASADSTFTMGLSDATAKLLQAHPDAKWLKTQWGEGANSQYHYVELPDGETIKIRVSDHAKTSGLHDTPDLNIAPGEHSIFDIEKVLNKRTKSAWDSLKNAIAENPGEDADWRLTAPDWAIKRLGAE